MWQGVPAVRFLRLLYNGNETTFSDLHPVFHFQIYIIVKESQNTTIFLIHVITWVILFIQYFRELGPTENSKVHEHVRSERKCAFAQDQRISVLPDYL